LKEKVKKENLPKTDCKDCHGQGKLLRTAPVHHLNNIGVRKRKGVKNMEMVRVGTPCHCLKLRKVKEG